MLLLSPSSYGNIHNIRYLFHLKSDPEIYGNPRYELSCEKWEQSKVLCSFVGKYYIEDEIGYNNYIIRGHGLKYTQGQLLLCLNISTPQQIPHQSPFMINHILLTTKPKKLNTHFYKTQKAKNGNIKNAISNIWTVTDAQKSNDNFYE